MIQFKTQLKKKEEGMIVSLISELVDFYGDFYITKNNIRLFIRENPSLLIKCLKQGDKMIYHENEGLIFVTGFSDKSERKYIKPLARDTESADRLIKVLVWHMKCDLWVKIKKKNPIRKALLKNNFRFAGDRGKEILLMRKYIPQKESYKGARDVNRNKD